MPNGRWSSTPPHQLLSSSDLSNLEYPKRQRISGTTVFAHCAPEVLEHLPTTVTGVKLAEGPSTSDCETCALSKAHKIVSRRPSPQAEDPFDRVHWDLIYMEEGFNGDRYISHFLDDRTSMIVPLTP